MAAPALYRRPTLVWGPALPASSSPFSVTNLLRAPVDVCWEKLAAGEAWGLVLASANWAVGVDDGVAGAGGVVFSSAGLVVVVVVVVVVGLVVGLVVDSGTYEGGSWAVGVDDGVAGAGRVVLSSAGWVLDSTVELGTHEGESVSKKPGCMVHNQAGACVCVCALLCLFLSGIRCCWKNEWMDGVDWKMKTWWLC